MRMNLMGVVYIMTCSFFSLDPHIDSVISPLGLLICLPYLYFSYGPLSAHIDQSQLPLTWPVVSATMLLLFTNLKSIFVLLPDQSIRFQCWVSFFFFYQHGSKITRETRRRGRVADEGWWSFRGKLLRTVKPMNRRDKWSNLKGP